MNIIGISAFYHDSAACIVQEGKIVAAAQEERFTRKKHDQNFPSKAIQFCLSEAKCAIDEIDAVIFYDKPFLKFNRLLETYLSYAPKGFRSFIMAIPLWLKENFASDVIADELDMKEKFYLLNITNLTQHRHFFHHHLNAQ